MPSTLVEFRQHALCYGRYPWSLARRYLLKVLREKIQNLKRYMFSLKHVMQPVVGKQTCLAVQDSEHVVLWVRSSMSFRLAFWHASCNCSHPSISILCARFGWWNNKNWPFLCEQDSVLPNIELQDMFYGNQSPRGQNCPANIHSIQGDLPVLSASNVAFASQRYMRMGNLHPSRFWLNLYQVDQWST
jgi:hypothetical protein